MTLASNKPQERQDCNMPAVMLLGGLTQAGSARREAIFPRFEPNTVSGYGPMQDHTPFITSEFSILVAVCQVF
jgi:hypothetical protein